MDVEQRKDGWWITSIPDSLDCGPYAAKAEAAKDRAGMVKFFKHEDDREFFTVERASGPRVAADVTTDVVDCAEVVKCAG